MSKKDDVLLALVIKYDKARTAAAEADRVKEELNQEIKTLLADNEEAAVPGWKVTYKYDKDKEVKKLDTKKLTKNVKDFTQLEQLKQSADKILAKYTTTTTERGNRRLIVESNEDE